MIEKDFDIMTLIYLNYPILIKVNVVFNTFNNTFAYIWIALQV